MITSELLALTTLLAPGPPTFRQLQCAHRAFAVGKQHQFMMRRIWRTVVNSADAVYTILPNGKYDGKYDGIDTGKYDISRTRIVYTYRNGIRWGPVYTYYTSGHLYSRGTYIADKLNGRNTIYWMSGKAIRDVNYVDDIVHGIGFNYYASGKLGSQHNFVNGRLDGVSTYFYESGQLQCQCTHVDGVLHGELTRYHKTGELHVCDQYVDGNVNGESRIYYPTGELCYVRHYIDNVQHGEHLHYYKSGQLCERTVFDHKRVVERVRYDEDGSIILSA